MTWRMVSIGAAGLERRPAGEQFVEDRPERVDVGGRADLLGLAAGLLGGHVRRRAEDGPALRLRRFLVDVLGQAEVGDLGGQARGRFEGRDDRAAGFQRRPPLVQGRAAVVAGPEQDVGRLQVAVDDAALVGEEHGAGQRLDQLGRDARGQRSVAHPLFEAAPLDELEGEVGPAVVLAGLVDLDDVGVLELGDRFRFGLEPGQPGRPGVRPGQDHLEGDEPAEALVAGLVDDPHAAPAEFRQDVVARYGRPLGQEGRIDERLVVGGGGVRHERAGLVRSGRPVEFARQGRVGRRSTARAAGAWSPRGPQRWRPAPSRVRRGNPAGFISLALHPASLASSLQARFGTRHGISRPIRRRGRGRGRVRRTIGCVTPNPRLWERAAGRRGVRRRAPPPESPAAGRSRGDRPAAEGDLPNTRPLDGKPLDGATATAEGVPKSGRSAVRDALRRRPAAHPAGRRMTI